MIDDNDLKNIFNNSSLKNEDWLQPADVTYDRIAKEIEKKRKRRFAFWLWLGAGMLVLALIVVGLYANKNNSEQILGLNEKSVIQNVNSKKDAQLNEAQINELKEVTSAVESVNLNEKEIIEATKIEYSNTNFDKRTNRNSLKPTSPGVSNFIAKGGLNSFSKQEDILFENAVENLEKDRSIAIGIAEQENDIFKKLDMLEPIPSIGLSMLPAFSSSKFEANLLSPSHDNRHFGNAFFFSLGYSNWNFKLNENFNSAVSPADFRKSNGHGFAANFGYAKKLGKRFQVRAALQYEKVALESGHNSAFTYDVTEETIEGENRTDLSMATPLGFVSSPVVVSRLSSGANTMYDLTLDLSNRHILQNLDIGLDLNYDFISFAGFQATALAGFGWNRILSVKNELHTVTTGDGNFVAEAADLVSEQGNLQSNRMYYALGFSMKKNITERNQLWLSYSYKKDFNSIFKLDELSSALMRNNLQLGLLRQF